MSETSGQPAVPAESGPAILVAEDEPVSRTMIAGALKRAGFLVQTANDGTQALAKLSSPGGPQLAVIDWEMPGYSGPEVCARLRDRRGAAYVYVILLTARNASADAVFGLQSGADDFLSKPFNVEELIARVRAGSRIVSLEAALSARISELQHALEHVHRLEGLLPICMVCKKIRNDSETWERIESYVESRTGARFSHSLCGDCLQQKYPG